MRTFLYILLFPLLYCVNLNAQVYITSPVKDTLCPGNTFVVNYTADPGFSSNNIFRIELSDLMGVFPSTPLYIGEKKTNLSGSIVCTVPLVITQGNGYRVRIRNTDQPANPSANNGNNIRIQNYPMPIAISDTSACQGGSFVLDIANPLTGGVDDVSYTWYRPNGSLLTVAQQIALSNATMGMMGRYVVIARYFGCIANDTTNFIIIKPRPAKPVVIADDTLCSGDTLYLSANSTTPNITYKWMGPNSFTSSSKDTILANTPFAGNGYYKAVAYLDGCPSLPDSAKVVVELSPDINPINNSPFCDGGNLLLYANGNTPDITYTWTGPASFVSSSKDTGILMAGPTNAGDYILTAQLGKCSTADTTTVVIKPLPVKPDGTSNSPVCSGTQLLLSVTNNTNVITYNWIGPNNLNASNPVHSVENTSLSDSGKYIVTADLNGCKKSDTTLVIIKPTPPIPSVKTNSPLREKSTATFEITNPLPGAIYTWLGPLNFNDTGLSTEIINAPDSASGIYSVTVDLNGCINIGQSIIMVSTPKDTGVVILYPNPNNGNFTIKGYLYYDEQIPFEIHNSIGQSIYRDVMYAVNKLINTNINISSVASGVYSIHFKIAGRKMVLPFIIIDR